MIDLLPQGIFPEAFNFNDLIKKGVEEAMPVKVALIGPGRMGQVVARNLLKDPFSKLVLVVSRPGSDKVGKDLGDILELRPTGLIIRGSDELAQSLSETRPEIVIDFTVPEASLSNLKIAAKHGSHLIVGTTGFSKFQVEALRSIASMYNVSLVVAPNLSIGINMLIHAAKEIATVLDGFDVEIIEEHHRYKKDAPSGTAIRLAQTVARELGINPDKNLLFGRHGKKVRDEREIAVHAIRGGGTIGMHKIVFISDNERLEIRHESLNRDAFTDCLMRLIKYVHLHSAGFYTVEHILGLETMADDIEEEAL
ncbi:MAG TPA: 4-hydroxy-tetrahydrodipicolinate reductase [Spirochaetia bacterium]|nr:4-hydroxy-tetrahydrodipicolinate reductase [Spirochaetia bacterium]